MRDFTKRRGGKGEIWRFAARVACALVLFFVTVVAVRAAWGMYGKFVESAQGDTAAEQDLAGLQSQEAQISAAVQALSSARGQEAQMRQEYGVALPGEGEIQIVRAAPAAATSTPNTGDNLFVRAFRALIPF